MKGGILAVVVAYHPQREVLEPLLLALAPQVGCLLVVDNTPDDGGAVEETLSSLRGRLLHLRLLRMGYNAGIGAALNAGIRTAVEEEFDYVLLSDQDSLPDGDMVARLVEVERAMRDEGVQVGCVCAAYVDQRMGHAFGFQVHEPGRLFYSTRPSEAADPCVEIITGITSGSLHPCGVFSKIGYMREDWFIDYVDTEWFHRARSLGYRHYGTPRAVLNHRLGETTFRVWYGHWRPHNGYSAQRLYYRFRNFMLLLRLPYVPWRWKVRASWYWLGNAYAYLIFAPNRLHNLRFIVRGLWDGIRSRTGPIESV